MPTMVEHSKYLISVMQRLEVFKGSCFDLYAENDHNSFKPDQLVYNPVPEPGILLLLGAGLIGFDMYRKSRMNRLV
jgi:PEP-CTERM motif